MLTSLQQIMRLMVLLYPIGYLKKKIWMPDVAQIMQISKAKHGGKKYNFGSCVCEQSNCVSLDT